MRPRPGSRDLLPGTLGAFTRLIVKADGREAFAARAAEMLAGLELDLVGLEDVRPYAEFEGKDEVTEEMAGRAAAAEEGAVYGDFHDYDSEGEA